MIENKANSIKFISEKFNPVNYENEVTLEWVETHAWYTICETNEQLKAFFEFVKVNTSLTNQIANKAPLFVTNAYDGIGSEKDIARRLLQNTPDNDPGIRKLIPVRYVKVDGKLVCELIKKDNVEQNAIRKKLSDDIEEIQQKIEKAIDVLEKMEQNKLKLVKKLEEI